MPKPIILMAFANERADDQAYLRNLPKEQRIVYARIREAERDGHCELVLLPYATTDQIFDTFQDQEYQGRIAVFHYGGHANSYQLLLEGDQGNESAHAEGLLTFLASQEKLQLVFLNGCSTKEQAVNLVEKGIPAVIGTSSSIHDDIATFLADRFYAGLSRQLSISKAFEDAESYLLTKKGSANKRDLYWEGAENTPDEFPWQIHHTQENATAWTLGKAKPVKDLLSTNGRIKQNDGVNEHIVLPVYEAMVKLSPKLAKDEEDYDDEEEYYEEIQNVIIKSFPLPISTQLRKLFAYTNDMVEFGLPRLEQIAQTYSVISQFSAFVLLVQLWDEKHHNADFKLEGKGLLDFQTFFTLSDENWQDFNYVLLLKSVADLLKSNNVEPFIAEFASIAEQNKDDDSFYQAYHFLEKLRLALHYNEVKAQEVETFCHEGEYHLSVLLQNIAFLVNYRLVTVKDISFEKVRYQEPEYAHTMGVLRGMEGSRIKENIRSYDEFSESDSIIIVRNIKDIEQRLNLSPFLMDANAFTESHTPNFKVHFFRYQNDNQGLTYEFVDVKDEYYHTYKPSGNADVDKLKQLDSLYKVFLKDFEINQ